MTYGFKFLNDNNETVLDDSNVKPWFYGQAPYAGAIVDVTSTYVNVLNQTDPSTGAPFTPFSPGETFSSGSSTPANRTVKSWTVFKIAYTTPAAYNCFVLFNLPVNTSGIHYLCRNPVSLAGNTTVELFAFVPNTWIATEAQIPKAYIFVADAVPTAQRSTGYGIQIKNQSQQLMFDSGKRHLQVTAFPSMLVSGDFSSARDYTRELVSAPSSNSNEYQTYNAAWLLPYCRWVWVYPDGTGTWYNNYYEVLYSRNQDYTLASNRNSMGTAEAPTFRTTSQYTDRAGMYFGPNVPGSPTSITYLPTFVVDATPLDQGYTPPTLPQSFTLTRNKAAITENSTDYTNTVIITLTTVAVPNGTVVPFTITGIQAADIAPMSGFTSTLTGSFLVVDNLATKSIQAVSDALIEGTETATLALDNGKASINFTISDVVSYSLSSFMTPEEGQSITVTLTTQGVANGTLVPYTVTGITAADLSAGSLTGNFTVSSNTASINFSFAKDAVVDNETMRISINSGANYLDIPITNVPYMNEVFTISPSTFATADTTTISITGGQPNTGFEYIILPTGTDPVYAWNNRWLSQYQSTVGTAYFDASGNYLNTTSTGTDFGGVGNWTLWVFTLYSKNFRSANVTVTATPTFSITGTDGTKGPWTTNEGTTGYFKVTTTNLPNGTLVYPKLIGGTLATNDYTNSAASGVAVQNNVANFNIIFTADQVTEGSAETATLVVQYPNGTTKDTYGVITVNDTSLTPATYTLTRTTGASQNEGTASYFYLTTNQTTDLYWTLNGTGITANDIVAAGAYDANGNYLSYGPSLSGIINQTYYQLIVYFKADVITEGAETLTVNIRTGSTAGTIVASATVVINDTSVYPAAGTNNGSAYCGTGANQYTLYQNKNDGAGGVYSTVVATNSPTCGYIAYNETVTATSDAYSDYIVELGNYITIVVGGGAPYTTFTYQITNNTDPQPTTFTGGPITLDGYGSWVNYITGATFQGGQTIGDRRIWVKFAYDNNVRSARVKVVYNAGTLSGGQYCVGTTLTQNYNDGHGGTYAQTVQTNSTTCGYVQQYYPYMSQTGYIYYNVDYVHDLWYIYGAKPSSTVTFTIVAGPAYVGSTASITTDIDGFGSYDIGNLPYAAGTYTINATFPGNNASYPTSYRTLVFSWTVYAASGGGGGGGY